MRQIYTYSVRATFALALGVFINQLSATTITGTLQIGNGLVAVNGAPAMGCVDFYNVNPGCGTPGMFTVDTSGTPGSFAAATGTNNNVIKDMQQTFPLLQFITLPSVNIFFDLPSLTVSPSVMGDCSAAATSINETCSPAGSPFTITNGKTTDPMNGQANSVTVELDVNVLGYQGSASTGETPYHGTFTTQIDDKIDGTDANIADVLAALNRGETLTGNSYSATLSPSGVVPEPGSFVMLLSGAGLLGLGCFMRHRRTRV